MAQGGELGDTHEQDQDQLAVLEMMAGSGIVFEEAAVHDPLRKPTVDPAKLVKASSGAWPDYKWGAAAAEPGMSPHSTLVRTTKPVYGHYGLGNLLIVQAMGPADDAECMAARRILGCMQKTPLTAATTKQYLQTVASTIFSAFPEDEDEEESESEPEPEQDPKKRKPCACADGESSCAPSSRSKSARSSSYIV